MSEIETFDKYYQKYDDWFVKYEHVYQSEIKAIKHFIPDNQRGIEVGVGSGRFAKPLGIEEGVEPSKNMKKLAEKRGITVYTGLAENLPLKDDSYDFVLMVTTLCFLDDVGKAFLEVNRILKNGGFFIVGFIDKNSPIGKQYTKLKTNSTFYKQATFYSTSEVLILLEKSDFTYFEMTQTVFGKLDEINNVQNFKTGFGRGTFVVIRSKKSEGFDGR